LAPGLRRRAESLHGQIEDKKKLRDATARAERERPQLSTTQAAIGSVTALIAKVSGATEKERLALRIGLVQQMRAAFFEIVFRPHAIVGLIELPEKPKSLRGAFGMPRPIDVRVIDRVERYFLRHVFFRDDPDELAALGGGKGIVFPKFG
jgi:hypothetical protein